MTFNRIIKEVKKEINELKFLVLGFDNAGKTTILHNLFKKPIKEVHPTFGYQIHTFVYKLYNLIILDIGGQQVFRNYWSNYYENIDGVVFVFDVTDVRPFLQHISEIRSDLPDTPLLILANKCDINYNFCSENLGQDFTSFINKDINTKLFKCSGIDGTNLEEGVDWLIEKTTT